jgi:inner membrane protein
MDYITHTLFGVAIYGALNKIDMSARTKWALLGTAVGSSVIPDIDLQWARDGASYLMSHRGITHSFAMVPVWAAMFYLLSWAVFRVRDWRLFATAAGGVLLHIVSDWTNAWGTGLLEPFTSRRYAIGIIPNKGYVFWVMAAAILPFLFLYRSQKHRQRLFRIFWAVGSLYACFQIAHTAYVYVELQRDGHEQVAIRADRMPGGLSYYGIKEEQAIEGRHEIGKAPQIVKTYRNDPIDLELLKAHRPARDLLLFAPFVVTQDLGDEIRVFDPRFEDRVSFLNLTLPKPDETAVTGAP